jgi:hypothetical protein
MLTSTATSSTAGDKHFFGVLPSFTSQDFVDSSNQEFLLLKSMIDGGGSTTTGEAGHGFLASRRNSLLMFSPHASSSSSSTSAPSLSRPSPPKTQLSEFQLSDVASPVSVDYLFNIHQSNNDNTGVEERPFQSSAGLMMPTQQQQLNIPPPPPPPAHSQNRQSYLKQQHQAGYQGGPNTNKYTTPDYQQQDLFYPAPNPTHQQLQQQQPEHVIMQVSPPTTTKRMLPTKVDGISSSTSNKRAKPSSAVVMNAQTTTTTTRAPRSVYPTSIKGEARLNIKFTCLGEPGVIPQRFGKHECGIPNGLSGTLQMYDQRWRMLIEHFPQPDGVTVLIRWTITNLTSGTVTTQMETMQDAIVRETCGRTICNNVLKQALETRAQELEQSMEMMIKDNPTRAANVRNLVKVLRPKRCTVGLLFFGLLHEQVQTELDRAVVAHMSQNQRV